MRYILRRLGFYLLAAWVALTLNFFLPRLMPGDPATALFARFRGRLGPEALDALRETFGLTDAPLLMQYVTYLGHVLKGDLGISVAYFPTPVAEVIGSGLVWTIFLAGSAVILSFIIVLDIPRLRRGVLKLSKSRLQEFYEEVVPGLVAFGSILGKMLQAQAMIAVVNTILTVIGLYVLDGLFDMTLPSKFFLALIIAVSIRARRHHLHEHEDERVVAIIRKAGGRMTQKELRQHLPLSEAKVSLLVSDLHTSARVEQDQQLCCLHALLGRDPSGAHHGTQEEKNKDATHCHQPPLTDRSNMSKGRSDEEQQHQRPTE